LTFSYGTFDLKKTWEKTKNKKNAYKLPLLNKPYKRRLRGGPNESRLASHHDPGRSGADIVDGPLLHFLAVRALKRKVHPTLPVEAVHPSFSLYFVGHETDALGPTPLHSSNLGTLLKSFGTFALFPGIQRLTERVTSLLGSSRLGRWLATGVAQRGYEENQRGL
jgi:hypothetical protein